MLGKGSIGNEQKTIGGIDFILNEFSVFLLTLAWC
jgi:hypothetical protein